jgi:hypothetical protein
MRPSKPEASITTALGLKRSISGRTSGPSSTAWRQVENDKVKASSGPRPVGGFFDIAGRGDVDAGLRRGVSGDSAVETLEHFQADRAARNCSNSLFDRMIHALCANSASFGRRTFRSARSCSWFDRMIHALCANSASFGRRTFRSARSCSNHRRPAGATIPRSDTNRPKHRHFDQTTGRWYRAPGWRATEHAKEGAARRTKPHTDGHSLGPLV